MPATPAPAAAGPPPCGIAEDSNLGGASRCCEGNDEGAAVAREKGRTRTVR
jgi:hypothetical protein